MVDIHFAWVCVRAVIKVACSSLLSPGIPPSGAAILDDQKSQASITVEASNDPHGVFSLAPSSLQIEAMETNMSGDSYVVVDRKFGSIGKFRKLVLSLSKNFDII